MSSQRTRTASTTSTSKRQAMPIGRGPAEVATKVSTTCRRAVSMGRRAKGAMSPMRLATLVACSICLAACLVPVRQVECGRLQEFIQNLVGGGSSSSSSSSSNNKDNSNKDSSSSSNSNSNSNNNDSNDSDTAASNDSNEQPLTPMMSAMNPFMRYPSFYDSFGPAAFGGASAGGFPGMSAFSGPMASAMSALNPMAAMSSQSLGGAFSPASFSPASFGSSAFGSAASNPVSAFTSATGGHPLGSAPGMSASSLSNMYTSSPANFMGGAYSPYYGRRR